MEMYYWKCCIVVVFSAQNFLVNVCQTTTITIGGIRDLISPILAQYSHISHTHIPFSHAQDPFNQLLGNYLDKAEKARNGTYGADVSSVC